MVVWSVWLWSVWVWACGCECGCGAGEARALPTGVELGEACPCSPVVLAKRAAADGVCIASATLSSEVHSRTLVM